MKRYAAVAFVSPTRIACLRSLGSNLTPASFMTSIAVMTEGRGPLVVPEDNPACPILAQLETLPDCSPPTRNENPF